MLASSIVASLVLAPLLAAAGPVLRADTTFSFTMYDSDDCTGPGQGPYTGSNNQFPECSAPLPHPLGSVFVASNAGGSCPISFYTKADAMLCFQGQARQPNFRVGHCYKFDPNNRPTSWGVQC